MRRTLEFAKRNIYYLIIAAIAIVGIIIGKFFDFRISESLYSPSDPGNAFQIIFAGFAEFPCYLFCVFGGIGLIVTMPKDKKWKIVLSWIIGLAAILIATGLGVKTTAEYLVKFEIVKDFARILQIIGVALVVICSAGVVALVIWKKDKFNKVKLFKISIYMIALAASFVVFSNIVKYMVCRPRPLLVFAAEKPEAIFRQWYIIKPLSAFGYGEEKDLYLSFPSGHTGAAATLVGFLPMLFSLFNVTNKKRFEIIGVCTGLLFALLTAFARIWCGAHFLADVSMGIFLVMAEIILIKELSPIIFRKVGIKDE